MIGNHGLNSRLKASVDEPIQLHINDFDQNGSIEHILTQYENGVSYPVVLKPTLQKQIPQLRKQLLRYTDYKDKTMTDLFSEDILRKSITLEAKTLSTTLFMNKGNGKFKKSDLPSIIQSSPVYAIHSEVDEKGTVSVILGGNQSRIKPELGINMGSFGWLLKKHKGSAWKVVPAENSGIYVTGELRDIGRLKTVFGEKLIILRNNDSPLVVEKFSYEK